MLSGRDDDGNNCTPTEADILAETQTPPSPEDLPEAFQAENLPGLSFNRSTGTYHNPDGSAATRDQIAHAWNILTQTTDFQQQQLDAQTTRDAQTTSNENARLGLQQQQLQAQLAENAQLAAVEERNFQFAQEKFAIQEAAGRRQEARDTFNLMNQIQTRMEGISLQRQGPDSGRADSAVADGLQRAGGELPRSG